MHRSVIFAVLLCGLLSRTAWTADEDVGHLRIRVVDDATEAPVPARIYVADEAGRFHLPPRPGADPLITYDLTDGQTGIRETYAAVGLGALDIPLPAGRYRVTVERGKEYRPLTQEVVVQAGRTVEREFRLARAFNMAVQGWYSADCHVHTPLADLPVAQLAEDLNVAFPVTAWTHSDDAPPAGHGADGVPNHGRVVPIDDSHVYWNLNTEYEIARMSGDAWTFGSWLILGHQTPFTLTAPPVGPVAEEARRQGAVLDWEKHSWPWSLMLVPMAGIDTAELSNNSMWRQRTFHHYLWGRTPPPWIHQPLDVRGFIEYGFESFYAMLNCGFALRPSAGSANGVHPVPLGHSRVYAHIDGAFSYEKWMAAFRRGRSFATNGPMLLMKVDGLQPGDRQTLPQGSSKTTVVELEMLSTGEITEAEIVVNGKVIPAAPRAQEASSADNARWTAQVPVEVTGTSWIAARCFERSGSDNPRFAHTGTVFFDDSSRPLRPEPRQIEYIIDTLEEQIRRSRNSISPEALREYEEALRRFRKIKSRTTTRPS